MPDITGQPAHASDTPAWRSDDGTGIDKGINYTTERFIDPDYLEAHRARQLPMDYQRNRHTAVVVAVDDQMALIDRNIAELIHAMWKVGIRTEETCEDHGPIETRTVFIAFESVGDAELLLAIACPEDGIPAGLWDRATGNNRIPGRTEDPPWDVMWDFSLYPSIAGRRVSWNVNLVFPVGDVPELVRRLRGAAQ